MTEAIFEVHPGPDGPICDFCSSTEKPLHRYGCKSFTVACTGEIGGRPVSESVGDWSACTECRKLIDADQWEALARRTAEQFINKHPDAKPLYGEMYNLMRDMQQEFRRARMGTS